MSKRQWTAAVKFTSTRIVPAPPTFRVFLSLAHEPDRVVIVELDAAGAAALRRSLEYFVARYAAIEAREPAPRPLGADVARPVYDEERPNDHVAWCPCPGCVAFRAEDDDAMLVAAALCQPPAPMTP